MTTSKPRNKFAGRCCRCLQPVGTLQGYVVQIRGAWHVEHVVCPLPKTPDHEDVIDPPTDPWDGSLITD